MYTNKFFFFNLVLLYLQTTISFRTNTVGVTVLTSLSGRTFRLMGLSYRFQSQLNATRLTRSVKSWSTLSVSPGQKALLTVDDLNDRGDSTVGGGEERGKGKEPLWTDCLGGCLSFIRVVRLRV